MFRQRAEAELFALKSCNTETREAAVYFPLKARHQRELAVRDLREFHRDVAANSRPISLSIGVVIVAVLGALSFYGYHVLVESHGHQIVANSHLPSP